VQFTTLIESSGRQALQGGGLQGGGACCQARVFSRGGQCAWTRQNMKTGGNYYYYLPESGDCSSRFCMERLSVCPNEYYSLYVLCAPYLSFSHIIFSLIEKAEPSNCTWPPPPSPIISWCTYRYTYIMCALVPETGPHHWCFLSCNTRLTT
jgi:hypothetical protein